MTSEAQKAGARRVFGRARALAVEPASDRAGAEPQLPPRRGRFASLADDRAEEIGALSAFEILFFDLLPTKGADSERIAMDRVRSLAFAGPYLAASHFICAMVLFIHQARVGLDPLGLALIGGVTIFAFLPYVLLTRRRTRELQPRQRELLLAFGQRPAQLGVSFYKDVLGLKLLENHLPHIGFEFGGKQLWIDKVAGMSQAEVWLQIVTDDVPAASAYFKEAGVLRCDEIEPLPETHEGFWIADPASIVLHLGAERGEW